jgi:hypothetical protein
MISGSLFVAIFPIIRLWAQHIEIITTIPYNFGVDVLSTTAAFETAAENVMQSYGGALNITIKYLFNQSHQNCDDVSGQDAQMLPEYYYNSHKQGTCYAVVTVGEALSKQ